MYAVFITFYHYITHIPFPVFIFSAKEKDAFYETSCPLSIYLLPVTVFPRTFLPTGPKSCQEVYSPQTSLYPSMLFSFSPLLPFSSFPPLPLPALPARLLLFPYCFLRRQEFRNSSRCNRFPLRTYNRARSLQEWCRRYTPHWWMCHRRPRQPWRDPAYIRQTMRHVHHQ